jgi:hypothetical protein
MQVCRETKTKNEIRIEWGTGKKGKGIRKRKRILLYTVVGFVHEFS